MQISTTIALLAAVGLDSILAQPHRHHHHKHRDLKDVDWNDPNNYAGVDWSTVSYGGPGGASSTPTTTTPVATATPRPCPPQRRLPPRRLLKTSPRQSLPLMTLARGERQSIWRTHRSRG